MRWLRTWILIGASALAWAAAPLARAQVAEPTRVSERQLRDALRRYEEEPGVHRVVRSALSARTSSPARIHDAMDRARATGWLPTTRAAIRRGQNVDLRALTGDADTTNISTDDDLMLEARMTFRFDRIVFAGEEVGLLRELRALEAERLELARAVVHLYFERRRLQLERDLAGARGLAHLVRILELEALLDVFTDGAFTRMMGRRSGGT